MAPKKIARGQKNKEPKAQLASKNGKKSEGAGGSSFFTWFMVLALLGVWTSVAVVYFDLVDYQGAIAKAKDFHIDLSEALQGKLSSYDTDGDGDFDVEDAKILLDGKPEHVAKKETKKENHLTKDVGWKLKEALKQQLAMIHERVEAKKIAKMALAEVRNILAKEEVQVFKSKDMAKKAKVAVASRLKVEEKMIEKEKKEKEEKDKKVFEKIRQTKQQKEDEEERRKAKEKKPGRNLEVASKKADEPKGAKSKGATKASAQKQKVSDKRNRK
uniref:Aspartyl beta-hydroxylase/Triadin domain-containing protein n=1 Tax=Esox lucius TaxID=8010 RepID=A0AAY5L2G3_ESOLU